MTLMTIMLATFVHIKTHPVQEIVYEGSNFNRTVCQKLTPNGTALDQCKYNVVAMNGKSIQITGWKKTKACIDYAKENGELPDMDYLRLNAGEISFEQWLHRTTRGRPVVYGVTKSRNDFNELNFRTENSGIAYIKTTPSEYDIDWMVENYKSTLRYFDDKRRISNSTPCPIYTGCDSVDMFMDDIRDAAIERECERLERQRIYNELEL